MLKIDRTRRTFSALQNPTLQQAGVLERTDLQTCIMNSSREFFAELGLDLFAVGQEIRPSDNVDDRIDVLAVDREGAVVVVELKRGDNKLQMLQAISYAGMVAHWSPGEFQERLSEEEWEQLTEFLEVDPSELNRHQRVLLVAEGYDYALLAGAEWLSERHGVDLQCCSVSLSVDPASGNEYLACASIYPPPAMAEQAIARSTRNRTGRRQRWRDWDHVLSETNNKELAEYFAAELQAGRENRVNKRALFYRVDEKRRWNLHCRTDRAYVWQKGRFDGDQEFWSNLLGDEKEVALVRQGRALRFRLYTAAQFAAFHDAVTNTLLTKSWSAGEVEDEG